MPIPTQKPGFVQAQSRGNSRWINSQKIQVEIKACAFLIVAPREHNLLPVADESRPEGRRVKSILELSETWLQTQFLADDNESKNERYAMKPGHFSKTWIHTGASVGWVRCRCWWRRQICDFDHWDIRDDMRGNVRSRLKRGRGIVEWGKLYYNSSPT